jgi:hypothetical protein
LFVSLAPCAKLTTKAVSSKVSFIGLTAQMKPYLLSQVQGLPQRSARRLHLLKTSSTLFSDIIDLHGRCDQRPDVRALFTKRRVNGTQVTTSRRQNQYSAYDFPFVSSPGAELFTSPMPPPEFTSSAGAGTWFHSQSGQTGSFGTSRK